MNKDTTDFGYRQVPKEEKENLVGAVFHNVATKYDVMNDLMSLGIHRMWKRFTIAKSHVRKGSKVLDVASGTGDLALAFAKKVGEQGLVVLSDINDSMLQLGRDKLLNHGIADNTTYIQANAENLPFPDNYFDCISIAFGLRNVTNKDIALASMLRVLKPGGQVLILEFSKPILKPLQAIYDTYSFNVLPWLGETVLKDPDSYRYLAESIRMHPDQETLKQMMETVGFGLCQYYNLSGGIVALHVGYKP